MMKMTKKQMTYTNMLTTAWENVVVTAKSI